MAKSSAQTLTANSLLEEYRINSILGQGGFGITYLALDTNLEQEVVIKEYFPSSLAIREAGVTVHPRATESTKVFNWGLDRFLQEARTLARFRHPNLVGVRRFFKKNGTAYMVMDYEEGESLGHILNNRQTPLSEAEITAILFPLLSGLKLVHAAGVIHRDIKPDNIFIRKDGSPFLLDFGAARQALFNKEVKLTIIGTPGYAPPEQFSEEGHQGPWTDIYAMGAVLFRIISGKRPPQAVNRTEALLNHKPDPLGSAVDTGKNRYSLRLLQGIDKALDLRKDNRPQDLDEWKTALFGEPNKSDSATINIVDDVTTVMDSSITNPIPEQAPKQASKPSPKQHPKQRLKQRSKPVSSKSHISFARTIGFAALALCCVIAGAAIYWADELTQMLALDIPPTVSDSKSNEPPQNHPIREKQLDDVAATGDTISDPSANNGNAQKPDNALQGLLQKALLAIDERRYLRPNDNNANYWAAQMLQLQPTSQDAMNVISTVIEHLLKDAKHHLEDGKVINAAEAIQELLSLQQHFKPKQETIAQQRINRLVGELKSAFSENRITASQLQPIVDFLLNYAHNGHATLGLQLVQNSLNANDSPKLLDILSNLELIKSHMDYVKPIVHLSGQSQPMPSTWQHDYKSLIDKISTQSEERRADGTISDFEQAWVDALASQPTEMSRAILTLLSVVKQSAKAMQNGDSAELPWTLMVTLAYIRHADKRQQQSIIRGAMKLKRLTQDLSEKGTLDKQTHDLVDALAVELSIDMIPEMIKRYNQKRRDNSSFNFYPSHDDIANTYGPFTNWQGGFLQVADNRQGNSRRNRRGERGGNRQQMRRFRLRQQEQQNKQRQRRRQQNSQQNHAPRRNTPIDADGTLMQHDQNGAKYREVDDRKTKIKDFKAQLKSKRSMVSHLYTTMIINSLVSIRQGKPVTSSFYISASRLPHQDMQYKQRQNLKEAIQATFDRFTNNSNPLIAGSREQFALANLLLSLAQNHYSHERWLELLQNLHYAIRLQHW